MWLTNRLRYVLPLIPALVFAPAARAQSTTSPAQIVATGEGETHVVPDRVYADVAVQTTAPTASAAASENARLVALVRTALQQAGVDASGLSDAGFSVRVRTSYDQGTTRDDGYEAVHTLRVETGALDRIGAFIDAALAAGANRVQEVRYTVADLSSARREAITAAVKLARQDAEAMASAAGGRLGALAELTTSRFGTPPGVLLQEPAAMLRVRDETTLTPRELVLHATVIGRWAFESR